MKYLNILLLLTLGFGQDYSLHFDGVNDYVDIANPNNFDLYDNFTINTKIKINHYVSNQGHAAIISKKPNNGWGGGFEVVAHPPYENGNGIGINYTSNEGNTSFNYFNDDNQIDTWYNVTIIYNGQSVNIYKDGILKASNPTTGNLGINNIPVTLGRRAQSGSYTHYFNGFIDEITIWSIAKDINELEIDYNSLSSEEGLMAHWNFNAGLGDILYDHSGNGNHGTIYGATWVENIYGCMDELAVNYNSQASIDDESCEYPDNGDFSLSFDGDDDYVQIPDLEVGNTYTIETTIFLKDDDISGQDFYSIINGWQGAGASSNCQFGVVAPHDKPYDDKLGYYKNGQGSVYGNKPDRNKYLKLNLVRNGSNFRLFINNQLVADEEHTDWNDDIYNLIGTWRINDAEISNRETWNGNIDDLKIWDYALSYEEINQSENSNNSENLIVDYQFNSGYGNTLYDHSGNGNHGVINGANWVENIYGCTDEVADNYNPEADVDDGSCTYPDNGDYSLSFDGVDDYVEIPHSSSLDISGEEITIISNIELNSVEGYHTAVISKVYPTSPYGGYGQITSNDIEVWGFGIATSYDGWGGATAQTKYEYNQFQTISSVYDGINNISKIYIDGLLDVAIEKSGTIRSVDANLFIGRHTHPGAVNAGRCCDHFGGKINSIFIFERALSDEEIENFNGDSFNSEGLAAHYKFNSGTNDILYDHSGNGNHGTINGATWVENIYGCMDELAVNYNSQANIDDESCEYPDNGDYSLRFDYYNSFVDLGSPTNLDFMLSNSFIIEMDIFIGSSTSDGYVIYSRGDGNSCGQNQNISIYYNPQEQRLQCQMRGSSEWDNSTNVFANNIEQNNWYKLKVVRKYDDLLKIFINDELIDSANDITGVIELNNEVNHYIGAYYAVPCSDSLQPKFEGLIDNFSIFKAEFISDVNYDSVLTLNYKFNSGEGTTLYDHSGNGNHGTINGAKWLTNGAKHVAVDGSDEEGNGSLDSPFSSIQYAIDTVSDSDTVLVSAGTYYENINFNGKNITLIGEDRETTIIDGGESGNVVQIANQEQNVSLINFTITNGSTDKGGGIYIDNTSPLLSNINIIGNSASENGAGLYVRYADLTIRDSFISNNSSGHDGGGIWFTQSLCSLENVTVESNFAENSGGGIHAFDRNSITMNSSYITENVANNCGGGVGLTDFSDLVIDSTSITNNETRGVDAWNMGSNGGGIFILNSSNVTLNESILSNNSAHLRGGAVYGAYDSNVSILNSSILNNIATNDEGGAMEIRDGSSAIIRDSKIMNNLGESTSGILVLIGSYIEINSSLFVNNISNIKDRGTIRFHIDSYGILNNVTIINENDETHAISMEVAGQYPIQIDNSIIFSEISVNSSDIYVSYSNINNGWNGSGNINQDPQFNSDYTLQASSPCIDAGDPGGDLDPDGTRGDMGAYPVYQESYGTLHSGANLKSFYTLPENTLLSNVVYSLGNDVTGVITEGGAASQLSPGTWVGSLTEISPKKGYWIILDTERTLTTYDGIPSESLVYDLHLGANLISFPSSGSADVSDALPDDIENSITGIITEGGATTQLGPGFWVGSLSSFQGGKGYWVISDDDISFSYDLSTLSRSNIAYKKEKLNGYDYTQSSQQAFYFVESIEGINVGDYILSFNGDKLIGSRQWQGSIIDVPTMGNDGNSYSNGYMKTGDTPTFKLLSNGKLTTLEGDIPAWSDNGLFMVSSLSKVVIPESYSLSQAYPNPFNPTTTLNFAIPVDNEVALSIYNLQGREIATLINGKMKAGYHSITWDASSNASGVYFVKMISGKYVNTQKLMLIK